MKYVMTYPIKNKPRILTDLALMKQDLDKQSKKFRFFIKTFNKANSLDKDMPLFLIDWTEIAENKIEILFMTSVDTFINPAKYDSTFFKIAKEYDAKIEKIDDGITGSMFLRKKKESK